MDIPNPNKLDIIEHQNHIEFREDEDKYDLGEHIRYNNNEYVVVKKTKSYDQYEFPKHHFFRYTAWEKSIYERSRKVIDQEALLKVMGEE